MYPENYIRFLVDEHRERIKEKIDHIALELIDKTKNYEEKYLHDLKEKLSFFDHLQSLEKELNVIEKRHFEILIYSLRHFKKCNETKKSL
jgi:hypothetical protein